MTCLIYIFYKLSRSIFVIKKFGIVRLLYSRSDKVGGADIFRDSLTRLNLGLSRKSGHIRSSSPASFYFGVYSHILTNFPPLFILKSDPITSITCLSLQIFTSIYSLRLFMHLYNKKIADKLCYFSIGGE